MNTLILFLTYDCNLNCTYCYQFHTPMTMTFSTAQKGVDLLLSSSAEKVNLDLYGGEPFLHFDLMREIITYAAFRANALRKRISFRTTTNGSFLSDTELESLSKFGVHIIISIDGTKHAHEACRGIGSFKITMEALDRLRLFPMCSFSVNSVVSPKNVAYFAESMQFLIETGIKNIRVSFDYHTNWQEFHLQQLIEQYSALFDFVLHFYREKHVIPLRLFKIRSPRKQPNRCSAGSDIFTVSPQGRIYGCPMLLPNLKKALKGGYLENFERLSLGDIRESLNVSELCKRAQSKHSLFAQSQDELGTDSQTCTDCDYFLICETCPADALAYSADSYTIPASFCEISKLKHAYRQRIREQVYTRDKASVWNVVDWP